MKDLSKLHRPPQRQRSVLFVKGAMWQTQAELWTWVATQSRAVSLILQVKQASSLKTFAL
jgi:hypothetical protein